MELSFLEMVGMLALALIAMALLFKVCTYALTELANIVLRVENYRLREKLRKLEGEKDDNR